ncbi:hypothetical protein H4219_000844 [Mycoemilia scoparia]|uniref:Uncharacterized protein n=1 Tax=Mycoemilia scoparia TaxID=417184 RepID=A0A9W8AB71_9FUNG|nr:hypothetical protein H4219_000844 [Mycoemilia scoparia]
MNCRKLLSTLSTRSGLTTRHLHTSRAEQAGLFGSLFGKKPQEQQQQELIEKVAESESELLEEVKNLSEEGYDRSNIYRFKEPTYVHDPEFVESKLKEIINPLSDGDWKSVTFDSPSQKLEVLSKAIEVLEKHIPDRALEHINSGQDLYSYYTTKPDAADSKHPVAKYFEENESQLPPNLTFVPFHKHQRKLHAYN